MTKFPQRNLFRILRSDCSSIIKKEKMYREVITPGRVSTRQPIKRGKACHFECFFHPLPVILKNFAKLDLFLMTKFPQRNLFRILRSDCSSIIKKEKMYREVIYSERTLIENKKVLQLRKI